jgi:DNA polymerase-3 subunit delta
MVAVKSRDIDGFIARPPPAQPVVLVFGPDAGLVGERVGAILKVSVDNPADPFALVRLEGDDVARDPGRLLDEANTVPMFGGRRALHVRSGRQSIVAAVEALLAQPVNECRVVVEAGDLKKSAPLRALCERARNAATIACYTDTEQDLARLIDEEMRAADLAIATDARAALLSLLGADRQASRNELRKLALYAHGKERVEIEDVYTATADASTLAVEAVVDAAFGGKLAELDTELGKTRAAAVAPGTAIGAALRQAMAMHRARLALDSGTPLAEAADQVASRNQFRRRPAVEAALRAWTAERLSGAIARMAAAALDIRRQPALAAAIADRTLKEIARSARRAM